MIIYRRIFGKIISDSMKANLEDILKEDLGWSYFSKDLDQESDEYNLVKSYVDIYDLQHDIIGVLFSDAEINNSEILLFNGVAPFAYPEPLEPKFADDAYDGFCFECGVFNNQINNFVIKKDPKLKHNKLVMLHWVTDELFCNPSLYNTFFKLVDIEFRKVNLLKKTETASSVIQLLLPELAENLDMKGTEQETCIKCGRIRFLPTISGFFPLPKERNFSIAKTREFFGSGHSSGHRILLTKQIMDEMIRLKLAKRNQFVPCR